MRINFELSLQRIGPRSMENWKDRLGIFASVTCAIHCAATPVLLATLPALKFTEWMARPMFHKVAAGVCCSIVAMAIWPAFLKFRDYRILSLSSLGLGLILGAAFFLPETCCTQDLQGIQTVAFQHHDHEHDHEHDHDHNHDHQHSHQHISNTESASMQMAGISSLQPWMTPLGGFFLIAAHGLNLSRRRKCNPSGCSRDC